MATEEVGVRLSTKDDLSPALKNAQRNVKGLKSDLEGLSRSGRGLDGATRSTLNWGGAFRHLKGEMAGFDAGLNRMIGRAAVGVGALTGGAVAWGLKSASSFELSKTALGTLLGGVAEGNAMFAEMQAYNLAAPFDFQGITAAGQMLLQFGVAGDKMMPVLRGLGDIAALTSNPTENLKSMALAMGQISGAGVMRAQDMNQLVQAGFPAYALLSEISGKTSAQLRKDMEVGLTLPAEQFISAVANMDRQVLEVYKGGAKRQNDTLAGQWANFKDRLSLNLAAGLEPSLPQIKAELPKMAESLADAIAKIGPMMPGLIDSMVQLAPVVVDLTGGFAELVTTLAPIVSDVTELMGPNGVKALLGVLLGYAALGKAANAVKTFSGALAILRGVEAGTAAGTAAGAGAGAAGGAAGAASRGGRVRRFGRGFGAGAILSSTLPFMGENIVNGYNGVAGPVGTVLGGTVGMAARSAVDASNWVWDAGLGRYVARAGQGPFGDRTGQPIVPTTVQDRRSHGSEAAQVFVGGITVNNPASNVDVERAVSRGIENHLRQRRMRE